MLVGGYFYAVHPLSFHSGQRSDRLSARVLSRLRLARISADPPLWPRRCSRRRLRSDCGWHSSPRAGHLAVTGAALGAWWQRRRRPPPQRAVPGDIDRRLIDARFDRLEQLAEQTALEVERVAEGQRFTTKLLAERASPNVLHAGSPGRPVEHRTPH